ncbi:NAD(P)-binding domain-containing protein [Heyndrickxia acidicola]|uniref:NAD(P)-binding domain-containing protein n=1 Tax=Heyndrickxia acidicola TaxID=209389 RepID=A0ABU6MGA5_9BACI|nr:NAD(P)-binding domain-containing protein [Heyndrickxia acidicola]MED1203454.1 NAD(P)-binding domain-containing protein [Heyndrickxia acidicola]
MQGAKNKTAAIISMTAKKSSDFRVLPRREALGFTAINFLVTDLDQARECLLMIDGRVEYILIDVEQKQHVPLVEEARRIIKQSRIITCKPNDATIESCDLLVRHYFNDEIENKSVLVIGSGNLSTKTALRLAERNAKVSMYSRSYTKTKKIAEALNLILPKYTLHQIHAMKELAEQQEPFDIIISFLSAENIVGPEYLLLIKEDTLVIDGGVNNFQASFIKEALKQGASCYRLDVRIAFLYNLLFLSNEVDSFFICIMGRKTLDGVDFVSGGIIGNAGDIIVDRINNPTQIIGIADGYGGVKSKADYTKEDERRINDIHNNPALFEKADTPDSE